MKYFIDTEFLEGTQKKKVFGITYGNTKPTIDLISIGLVAEDGREYYAISNEFNLEEAWSRHQLVPDDTVGARIGALPPQKKVYWIRENVLLPIYTNLVSKEHNWKVNELPKHIYPKDMPYSLLKKLIAKYGKNNKQIARDIKDFCILGRVVSNQGRNVQTFRKHTESIDEWIKEEKENGNKPIVYSAIPEFYGYYADYDWVVFCWLFGKMIDLPKGFPMYCKDLKQMLDEKVDKLELFYGRDIWSNNNNNSIPTLGKSNSQEKDRLATFEEKLKKIKSLKEYPKQTNEHNALADAKWNKKLYDFIKSL